MDDKTDKTSDPEWLRKLPIKSEEIGFSASQMTACVACGKPNGPNREVCLYCGTQIGEAASGSLNVRELEAWEKGINVVMTDHSGGDINSAAAKLARSLGADRDDFLAILGSERPVPFSRVETAEQATAISDIASACGIKTIAIRDEDLLLKAAPTRLRSIHFQDGGIILQPFGGGDSSVIPTDDLALIFSGVFLKERRESIERKKRSSTTTVSETRESLDEPMIDIYSKQDPAGWRIPINGFDFSSLGSDKSLLATENIKKLVMRLRTISPQARLVDDYATVRTLLEYCWPSEQRKDRGPQRRGLLRKDDARVFTSDNLTQLTKYSRLQWHLL